MKPSGMSLALQNLTAFVALGGAIGNRRVAYVRIDGVERWIIEDLPSPTPEAESADARTVEGRGGEGTTS